ncbi:IS5 family transposase [Nonomuraea sp. NPDC049714]|uniref:IS5 family transposase n=1 Tax=Nonomuraea sp. NPDC049714 TaxID=3364357 RepID=UPI0037B0097B
MASVTVTRRHDLTDAQWAALELLLPAVSGCGHPPKWSRRQLIDGIRWRIRTGAPWRDVPEGYAPWSTVCGRFRRWQRDGTWAKILAALQAHADAAGKIGWTVSVDSTVSRAHQHAARARRDGHLQKEPPGGVQSEPDDHALGRSRGGLTTKTHLVGEQGRCGQRLLIQIGWLQPPLAKPVRHILKASMRPSQTRSVSHPGWAPLESVAVWVKSMEVAYSTLTPT